MSEFKKYRRKQIAELREVDKYDIYDWDENSTIRVNTDIGESMVSISPEDIANGSPKIGDMIARNPKNHKDQWLVAKEYFEDNFEEI